MIPVPLVVYASSARGIALGGCHRFRGHTGGRRGPIQAGTAVRPPLPRSLLLLAQAHDRDRTGDLILTKDVLYRLSYVSAVNSALHPAAEAGILHKRATGLEPATFSLEG